MQHAGSGIGRLQRKLGIPSLFSIATGSMISSGLFVLPAFAFTVAGPGVIFSYLIAGFLAIPTMLSKAELSTAMPKAGGTYYFVDRALGPLAGTLSGFAAWFSLSVKTAFAFVGLGIFMEFLSPEINGRLFAMISCILFTGINLRGAGHAGKAQIVLVAGLLISLALFTGFGLTSLTPDRFRPLAPNGFSGILEAAALVFVAFGGLTKVTSVSEEVKNPGRDLPVSMFLALIVVTSLYFVSVLICVGVLDPSVLSSTGMPISEAAKVVAGSTGLTVMSIAAVLAFLSTANAGILASARFPFAMSRDELLPASLSRISRKRGIPWVSILLTGIIIILLLFLDFTHLVKLASTMMILLYLLVNTAVIVMRESRIHTYKPDFRSPGYPWIQLLGIVGMIVLLYKLGQSALIASVFVVIGGSIWYFIYSRHRSVRHYALLHLAARIFPKELVRKEDGLVRELAEVLKERDNIYEDRFDRLVLDAPILDLDGPINLESFLAFVSDRLSPSLSLSGSELAGLLLSREKESTTALRKGLAIPHIIVPGEKLFSVAIARCRNGVEFGGENSPVRMIFVLAGSRDERMFHLRALMAIAEITSTPDFDSNWMKCRNETEIRDLILLSKRRRLPEPT
ncbi:MAG: amino acid permease [Candidatus Aegiribacteria sp.]|nr:amino acid permease [Candidatus Aegiribacteria sp.]